MQKLDYSWKGVDCFQATKIVKKLSVNCPYSQIDFSHNSRLDDKTASLLVGAISCHNTVTELKFSSSKLGIKSAEALGDMLCKNGLKALTLSNNNFDAKSIEVFSQGLRQNTSLESLNLSLNTCQSEGLKFLLNALQAHPKLAFLNLDNNSIVEPDEASFLPLSLNKALKDLSLYSNSLGKGAVLLLASLASQKIIERLNLEKNNIDASMNKLLALALEKNETLREINFANNSIGDKDFAVLAEAFAVHPKLLKLDLSQCQMNDRSFTHFFQFLSQHQAALKILSLKSNNMTSEGLRLAVVGCKNALFCTEIDLSHNKLEGKRGAQYLIEVLKCMPALQSLDVGACNLGKEGLEILVNYLLSEKNEVIALNLSKNQLGDQSAISLQKLIQQSQKLQRLFLDENDFTNKGAAVIFNALKNNQILTRISQNNVLGHKNDPMTAEIKAILSHNLEVQELKQLEQEIEKNKDENLR